MNAKKCPKCGNTNVEVVKTWNMVSPLPDKAGRITVTVMGSLRCLSCGYSWRGPISKLKVGGGLEIEGGRRLAEEEERPPKEIVLDVDEILKE
ncbi:MAG: chromatin protein Cren7 [Desulfurococcaceae archaeon]